MNTHIDPEFVVSLKILDNADDAHCLSERTAEALRHWTTALPRGGAKLHRYFHRSSMRIPAMKSRETSRIRILLLWAFS
ncbi:hypothetical protein PanWU01x14_131850, partial [Parasponia andersonii]